LRVTFLLPGRARRYSGGFAVVYRHAQGLAERGHDVALVHVPFRGNPSLTGSVRRWSVYWSSRVGLRPWSPADWLTLDRRVTPLWRHSIDDDTMPDADALVVSFWQSALLARTLSPSKGRKFYLVQEYEMFMSGDEVRRGWMREAFLGPYRVIPISSAVAGLLRDCGAAPGPIVGDGIDHDTFTLTQPIDRRTPFTVGFAWRPEPFKGTAVAVEALERARRELGSSMAVWAYGAAEQPVPPWIRFVGRPSDALLAEALNRTSVFVMASDYEGWGLPGAEALCCGAALATTDSGGVREYAHDGVTALVSPPRDAAALARNVVALARDEALRVRLAQAGRERVRQFTWTRAVDGLERALVTPTEHR
jgi:glycosyltransferase involved in cell wall biosynthesis